VQAPAGRITGLIGPNGAGKTTTFDACSGLVTPAAGRIVLDGRLISRWSPARRARAGLGRTFQRADLFESMTVRENVAMGAESGCAGINPLTHLLARPQEIATRDEATNGALALCGLDGLAGRPVSTLSTGQRRLVDLARCLAGDYKILLLDEPSSGLDRTETSRFGEVLERVVRERGVGILLVEHDIPLVLGICKWIYVLDFGQLIFEGTAADVASSAVVQAAYLGQHGMDAIDSASDTSARPLS
jgi:ABC-type branched-subunit amino acid transport system ATPase component